MEICTHEPENENGAAENNVLSEEDAALFDQLYFPLLNFVNKEYGICPELETVGEDSDVSDMKMVADFLWSHPIIIDAYLSEAELPDEHAQIVASWKQCKTGFFVIERHLENGSVFISREGYKVYVVKGLYETWEELLGKRRMELEAALIPFRDCIITDGTVVPDSGRMDRAYSEFYKGIYMRAKAKGKIIFSLNSKKAQWHPRKKKAAGAVESYEMKVSLEDDCYRNIRIGKQETLEKLSEVILDAFDFDDDHAHAFHMDDNYRSRTNVFYSDRVDEEWPTTHEVTLRQMALKRGNKFMFQFDFGEEWHFQCKVLRELAEKTDTPSVIESVGKAPEQYPSWDDEEDEDDEE